MLNEKQIIIAREVIKAERTITDIMEESGYCREVFYKWKRENREFQDLLKEMEEESKQEALSILKASSGKAAKLLVKAVEDGRISKSRIDAANSILDKAGLRPDFLYKNLTESERPEQLSPDDIKGLLERKRLEVV